MSVFERALARDPYYTKMVAALGDEDLQAAGFIPNRPDAPFPEGVDWLSLSFDKIREALSQGLMSEQEEEKEACSLVGRGERRRPIVLLTTGSFAPFHEGHLAMMSAAKEALTARGEWVVGGVISPSHDAYVGYKGDGQERFPAPRRMRLIEEGIEDSDWLVADSWEAMGVEVAVNFTDVIVRLEAQLKRLFKTEVEVVYVFGGDNTDFMRTFVGQGRAICIERPGYKASSMWQEAWIDKERHFHVSAPLERDISSTQKRRLRGKEEQEAVTGTYVVRNDWPMIAKVWGVDEAILEPAKEIEGFLKEGLPGGEVPFKRVEVEDQRAWAYRQVEGDTRPVVSLDMFFRPSYGLDVSRRFSCSSHQRYAHALCVRPEAMEGLDVQAARVPSGEVVLVDDDSVSGATIRFIEGLFGERVKMTRKVFLADALEEKKVYDVVDVRDFLLGAPFGGLVVRDPEGVEIRVPYMAPYVNLATRARLDERKAYDISARLWRWNAKVLREMAKAGAVLMQSEGLDRFAALSGHEIDWTVPFLSLSKLALWHAKVLEDVLDE